MNVAPESSAITTTTTTSTISRMRYRLRSPLRWLCATMSAMFLFAMVGVLDSLWLLPLVPLALGVFLLAPPLGPYHHTEHAPDRTTVDVALQRGGAHDVPNGDTWTLRLQNTGKADARHFRIRMTIPTDMLPTAGVARLLFRTHVGQPGAHWFVETGWEHTVLTFRAGAPERADAVSIAPGSTLDLAELLLPVGATGEIGYQINGGSVKTTLGGIPI